MADPDIRHAVTHFMYVAEIDPGLPSRVFYIGPDRAANLLELIAIERGDETTLVIHAMKMRRRFESLFTSDPP